MWQRSGVDSDGLVGGRQRLLAMVDILEPLPPREIERLAGGKTLGASCSARGAAPRSGATTCMIIAITLDTYSHVMPGLGNVAAEAMEDSLGLDADASDDQFCR